jgi:hypothetical protein
LESAISDSTISTLSVRENHIAAPLRRQVREQQQGSKIELRRALSGPEAFGPVNSFSKNTVGPNPMPCDLTCDVLDAGNLEKPKIAIPDVF